MTRTYRWFCKFIRLVHLWLGLLGLWLLLLFAVTGFMLNHEDWFGLDQPHRHTLNGATPTNWLKEPDRLAVVEHLRATYQIHDRLDGFEVEEEQLRLVFRAPGRQTEATVQREDGATQVEIESRGLSGWLTDLHRGKTTSAQWSLAIDLASVGVVTLACSGLLLYFTLKGKRRQGLVALMLGTVALVILLLLAAPGR